MSISSYSESSSQPNNAFLLIEDSISSWTIKTLFRILSYKTFSLNNVLSKGIFTVNEVAAITQGNIVLSILRTNLNINNIQVSSNSILDYVFINFISTEIKQLLIENAYFNSSGHIQIFLIFWLIKILIAFVEFLLCLNLKKEIIISIFLLKK